MPVTLMNPPGLPEIELYRQVSVASGSRMVFVAGQVARDAEGGPVGEGDYAAQAEQALLNVAKALEGAGASFDDVAKLTIYVVGLEPATMPLLLEGMGRAYGRFGITPVPPLTGVGVAALAEPDLLVEVEAVAVLD